MSDGIFIRSELAKNAMFISEGVVHMDVSSPSIPSAILRVDGDDFDFVRKHRWSPWKATNGVVYATAELTTKKKRERVLIHRQIMRARFDEVVDHINGDGLDNRKSNLRLCADNTINLANRHVRRSSSGFLGVAYRIQMKRPWMAHMTINGKQKRIGYFDTPEEAAAARDEYAVTVYGEFASLNFPRPQQ